jgi:thiol-disulfide isomerase/thioredoxin
MRKLDSGNHSRALVVTLAGVLLAACAPGTTNPVVAPTIEVDTTTARAIKARAQIADCPPAQSGNSALPDLTLPCLGGGTKTNLASLSGPLIINFFQSTCEPCRKELPLLARYAATDEVPVIGLNLFDAFPEAALELAEKSGVRFPLVADPEALTDGADPLPVLQGIPFTIVIGRDGALAGCHYGPILTASDLVDFVNQSLDTTNPPECGL